MIYYTLATDGQHRTKVFLSDGSRIWLNAGSQVKYPTSFNEDEKNVTMHGEAFFEVPRDKGKEFIVTLNGLQIITSCADFNINAYAGKSARIITLLAGFIQVVGKERFVFLSPGQQVQFMRDGCVNLNTKPDIGNVISWKKEVFTF